MAAAHGKVPSFAELRGAGRSPGVAQLFGGAAEPKRRSRWAAPTREPWRSIYRVAKAVCVDVPRAELRLVSSVLSSAAGLVLS